MMNKPVEGKLALKCARCGHSFGPGGRQTVCPNCGNTLWGDVVSIFLFGALLLGLFLFATPKIPSGLWRPIAGWASALFALLFLASGAISLSAVLGARREFARKPARQPVEPSPDGASPDGASPSETEPGAAPDENDPAAGQAGPVK
jgi:hypothetical protein